MTASPVGVVAVSLTILGNIEHKNSRVIITEKSENIQEMQKTDHMTRQHEFCCKDRVRYAHKENNSTHLFRGLVEHLALHGELVGSVH